MIHLVQSLDGISARSGHTVDSLLRMFTRLVQQLSCTLHGLDGNLQCVRWIESHLHTSFGLYTEESHYISDTTRSHQHAWSYQFFRTYKRVSHNLEQFFYLISYGCIHTFGSADERHAFAELSRDVRDDVEHSRNLATVVAQHVANLLQRDTCSQRNQRLRALQVTLDVLNHRFHLPRLYCHDDDVCSLDGLVVIRRDVYVRAVVLDFIEFLDMYSRDRDVDVLTTFAPSSDQCTSNISGTDNCYIHNVSIFIISHKGTNNLQFMDLLFTIFSFLNY